MRIYTLFILALLSRSAMAQTSDSNYHLFNAVPSSEMRALSIDRPDITESAITVDAGHFQFEGDVYRWRKSSADFTTINFMNGLYKLGLTNRLDIQFGIELYNIYTDPEGSTIDKGYGNTTVRLKYNFWGNNEKTRTALGVIPYITFPTSTIDTEIFFGAGFPFAYSLNDKLDLGAQFQFDFTPNDRSKYDLIYLQTIVLGGTLIGDLDFYTEVAFFFQEAYTIVTANGGLIYNVNSNLKIDVATNVGLNEHSYSTVFTGFSLRL